ncbi:unnamed protein product [Trifolium pratense]|uniref:Uncharacterized protein n=1 Tax=Trifolium pratense TaxID=57577 RepID=A0ACB0LVR4_TRIPR|nr:unnamed protein product [Trifolium pratense]
MKNMAQIFTLLVILSLFFVVIDGYVQCKTASDCPISMCRFPVVPKCIRYKCECDYVNKYSCSNEK